MNMSENSHEITEKKLQSSDHYRSQVQFSSRVQKLIIAGPYNFLAEEIKPIAQRVRTDSGNQIIAKCIQEFITATDANPSVLRRYWTWFDQNCHDTKIKKEMQSVVSDILGRQTIASY